MVRRFGLFDEIEGDLKINAPQCVYKYRTWNDKFHKEFLKYSKAWFSHPFDLNDPLDVRPEVVFNLTEINDPEYLEKMIRSEDQMNSPRDKRIRAENKLEEIRANPDLLIINRAMYNLKRENFDQIGVFSTARTELNTSIWEGEYGDRYKGYCLGFNTVEMCRQMKSAYGFVTYCDKPILFSFLNRTEDENVGMLYLKKRQWEKEQEFRFITPGIGGHSKRLQPFLPETVTELVLGHNMSSSDETDILTIFKSRYPSTTPIFKTKINKVGEIEKVQIR